MSELWRKGAVELAALIRDREVNSREVVQAHLDRIEAVNPQLNAIVRLLPDQALAAADAADRAVADGASLGPLHGVPCTVKENIDLAGTPTTQAVPALAEAVAPVDAPQVEQLRAAGAIPIGRTNLPDFGLRVHTHSALHGLTRNPWNPQRSPGGSSGGEAAALATGMSPLGLGNDLGGSLRNPAHCCGVASIKPSTGSVATATVIPPEDWNISFQLMAVEGVMARRAADVRAGFTAIAGQHPRDPLSVPAVFTDLAPGERPAVAVLPEPPGGSTHPEVAAAVRRAADALADDGFKVTEAVPPDYEQAIELWSTILTADLRVMKPVLDEFMGPGGRQFLDYALDYLPESDVASWAMAHTARARPSPPLEPVVPGLPGAAQPGLDPARLPAGLRHRQPRQRDRDPGADAPGPSGQPAGHPGRGGPRRDGRRPARRRPGHGRQVHRASLPGRRRDDRAATRNPDDAHPDRPDRGLTSPARRAATGLHAGAARDAGAWR